MKNSAPNSAIKNNRQVVSFIERDLQLWPSLTRRDPAQTRSVNPRARGSLPDRYRHRAAARDAQLRPARSSVAGEALSIDRPPHGRPRRPRARARRLLADSGNAGDRGGAGAASGLTQAGEVKAQASRRQRLTQLQDGR